MECISCRDGEEINRVVVNQLTGREHGVLCTSCETAAFGALLDSPVWHQEHGCAFCDDDGRFVLPELDCFIEYDDGSDPSFEYEDAEDAVRLCESHLGELLPDGETVARRLEV